MENTFFRKTKLAIAASGMVAGLFSGGALADSDGMISSLTGVDINDNELGVNVGGWVSFGGTYNTDNPDDKFNGPVTFNDRNLEFQMNQFNIVIERAVNTEADSWDLGFRVDTLFGTDARFTLNDDLDDDIMDEDQSRFYRLSFPQLYLELFAPIGNGITAKIGHFYTIIGNEVVTSPDNFFYSHAYTMQYGEPFEHTGVLLSTPVNDNLELMAGAVLGWDNFSRNTDVWSFLGGASWSNDTTSATLTGVIGDYGKDGRDGTLQMYSLVVSHDLNEKLHYLIQHDHGWDDAGFGGPTSEWYGINQYLTYDVSDQVAAAVRFEWFRDDDGARVNDTAGSYYAATAGINYSPLSWLKIRPEVRYDWFDGNADVFDGGTEENQLTVAADVVVVF